jgi:hypothetical protein
MSEIGNVTKLGCSVTHEIEKSCSYASHALTFPNSFLQRIETYRK